MLRKVYLTSVLPENTTKLSPKHLPDVTQKMVAFQREKRAYQNEAPTLRPNPLEKYDRRDEREIGSEDRDEEVLADEPAMNRMEAAEDDDTLAFEDRYASTISSLPSHVQRRAWRLLPFLIDKDIGDLNMRDVLYDLTVKNVKKIHSQNLGTLRVLYRQLDSDITLPKSYYVKKPIAKGDGSQMTGPSKQSLRASLLPSPPGQKNQPRKAHSPQRVPSSPVFHTKSSTPGTRAYGDEAAAAAAADPPGSRTADPTNVFTPVIPAATSTPRISSNNRWTRKSSDKIESGGLSAPSPLSKKAKRAEKRKQQQQQQQQGTTGWL